MSGYAGTTIPKPASANQPSWDSFSSLVGCSSTSGSVLDCLRGADSEVVMDAVRQVVPKTTFNWWPALDGANGLIPDLPSNIWAAGGYTQVPSIAGAHLDDGMSFTKVLAVTLMDGVRYLVRADSDQQRDAGSPAARDVAVATRGRPHGRRAREHVR